MIEKIIIHKNHIKNVMTFKGAMKAKEACTDAIVVSNHGGRVLDQCLSTAEILAEITETVKGSIKIFVGGGIRSGVDIFKAVALGAEAEDVKMLVVKYAYELENTMTMCGAHSLKEITKYIVRVVK